MEFVFVLVAAVERTHRVLDLDVDGALGVEVAHWAFNGSAAQPRPKAAGCCGWLGGKLTKHLATEQHIDEPGDRVVENKGHESPPRKAYRGAHQTGNAT